MIRAQPPLIFSFLSWYGTPQITAMLLLILMKARRGVLPGALLGTLGAGGRQMVDGAVGERSVFSYDYFYLPLVALETNHTCQFFFFSPARRGHVCLYRSAAYVAQLLSAEDVAGRGYFALPLGNGAVGKQESQQCTLD